MVVFTDKKCSHTESGSFTLRRNIQLKQWCQSKEELLKKGALVWSRSQGCGWGLDAGLPCYSVDLSTKSFERIEVCTKVAVDLKLFVKKKKEQI